MLSYILGESSMGLNKMTEMWKKVKDQIEVPFILLHAANENWVSNAQVMVFNSHAVALLSFLNSI